MLIANVRHAVDCRCRACTKSRGDYHHKYGPARYYSPEQLTIFRDHREDRERFRPADCSGGERCWVEHGPPAITGTGLCVGCRKRAGEVGKGYRGGQKVKV